ncbi:MAG: RluA family pseudouridine synthase [Oscillospiraceae bacterium]|nr:RluA family pseudouridine synthase [Oscillospiraceae bacterium]
MRELVFNITDEHDGKQAYHYLRYCCNFSYALIVKMRHTENSLLLDEVPIRTIDRIKAGSVLKAYIPEGESYFTPNPELEIETLYEDEDIVVFDKPVRMPVHPSKNHQTDTVANYCAARYGNAKFHVVGRLDMDTSGIIVIGKHAHSAAVLTKNGGEKEYIAIIEGVPEEPSGIIDAPIDDSDPLVHKSFIAETGQPSITEYETVGTNGVLTVVRVKPKTGRTHQIRLHFAHIGHPLCGDELYGGSLEHLDRQALHRSKMVFEHPINGTMLEFESPLPEDMKKLAEKILKGRKSDE